MKITIESTTQIVNLIDRLSGQGVPARVWEGKTESGVKVVCLIVRIAARADQDLAEIIEVASEFDRELKEQKQPEAENVFPLRMIL